MAVVESVLGIQLLVSLLSGDSTLAGLAPGGVARGEADPNTSTPVVIVAYQAGSLTVTTAGVRLLADNLYQCKVTGPANNTQAVVLAASQMDEVLGGHEGLRNQYTTGGYIGSLYRDGEIFMDNLVAGERWVVIGGLYRLNIQQTS